jgi:hypothetical protein
LHQAILPQTSKAELIGPDPKATRTDFHFPTRTVMVI